MGLDIEAKVFLIYVAAIAVAFLFGRLLLLPVRKLFKLVVNSLVGGVLLVIINIAGAGVGIVMPVNLITAVIAGVLGLPGVAGLVIYFNGIV